MRVPLSLLLCACAVEGAPGPRLPPPALQLVAPPLLRASEATFTVAGALPGERVVVWGTPDVAAPGLCPPGAPGCLAIGGRVTALGSARADAAGVAEVRVWLPPGPTPVPVAGQAVAPGSGMASGRLDASLVAVDPGSAGLLPVDLDATTATRPRVRELVGPSTSASFSPDFSTMGGRTTVLEDAAAWAAFQAAHGASLPAVDFRRHAVIAWELTVSATCGLAIEGYDAWLHPATRDVVLQVDLRDESAGCPVVCQALGAVALVVEVPRSASPGVVVDVTGGCLP